VPSSSPLCRPLVALAEPLGRGVAGRSPRPWSAVPSSSPLCRPLVALALGVDALGDGVSGEELGEAGDELLVGPAGRSAPDGPEAAATPIPVPPIAAAASAAVHVLRASPMSNLPVAMSLPSGTTLGAAAPSRPQPNLKTGISSAAGMAGLPG
jgi:hypothetical protein